MDAMGSTVATAAMWLMVEDQEYVSLDLCRSEIAQDSFSLDLLSRVNRIAVHLSRLFFSHPASSMRVNLCVVGFLF